MRPNPTPYTDTQDFHVFFDEYRARHGDDVWSPAAQAVEGQDVAALVSGLAGRGRDPIVYLPAVQDIRTPLVTNVFASRQRIARILGATLENLHDVYQHCTNHPIDPVYREDGPITGVVTEGDAVDLTDMPMIQHFSTDRGPYLTNAIIIATDPVTGISNLSYHRSMRHARDALATSLHSRGHLWRMYQTAKEAGRALPVAMVVGAHPLFMLAASARLPYGADERCVAGGLFGSPLELVRTPRHGIGVPAAAEFVLEGELDPDAWAEEGPFGEFTGYSSDRSTNNVLRVQTLMRRRDAWLVDVMGGATAEHLTLARLPREAEMSDKLRARFPCVTQLHYPTSGTHFHAYIGMKASRPGEARQVMLGLLGWDPYLKTVIAVDEDVDVTQDQQVLWALATHFQPHRDLFMIDGLPGSPLDPSSSADGTTSRLALDATRGADFHGALAVICPDRLARTARLLDGGSTS